MRLFLLLCAACLAAILSTVWLAWFNSQKSFPKDVWESSRRVRDNVVLSAIVALVVLWAIGAAIVGYMLLALILTGLLVWWAFKHLWQSLKEGAMAAKKEGEGLGASLGKVFKYAALAAVVLFLLFVGALFFVEGNAFIQKRWHAAKADLCADICGKQKQAALTGQSRKTKPKPAPAKSVPAVAQAEPVPPKVESSRPVEVLVEPVPELDTPEPVVVTARSDLWAEQAPLQQVGYASVHPDDCNDGCEGANRILAYVGSAGLFAAGNAAAAALRRPDQVNVAGGTANANANANAQGGAGGQGGVGGNVGDINNNNTNNNVANGGAGGDGGSGTGGPVNPAGPTDPGGPTNPGGNPVDPGAGNPTNPGGNPIDPGAGNPINPGANPTNPGNGGGGPVDAGGGGGGATNPGSGNPGGGNTNPGDGGNGPANPG